MTHGSSRPFGRRHDGRRARWAGVALAIAATVLIAMPMPATAQSTPNSAKLSGLDVHSYVRGIQIGRTHMSAWLADETRIEPGTYRANTALIDLSENRRGWDPRYGNHHFGGRRDIPEQITHVTITAEKDSGSTIKYFEADGTTARADGDSVADGFQVRYRDDLGKSESVVKIKVTDSNSNSSTYEIRVQWVYSHLNNRSGSSDGVAPITSDKCSSNTDFTTNVPSGPAAPQTLEVWASGLTIYWDISFLDAPGAVPIKNKRSWYRHWPFTKGQEVNGVAKYSDMAGYCNTVTSYDVWYATDRAALATAIAAGGDSPGASVTERHVELEFDGRPEARRRFSLGGWTANRIVHFAFRLNFQPVCTTGSGRVTKTLGDLDVVNCTSFTGNTAPTAYGTFTDIFTVTMPDNVPPTVSSAAVDGETLTLTFNEALRASRDGNRAQFTVTATRNSASRTIPVQATSLPSATTLQLTLEDPVIASDTVTVTYTPSITAPPSALQDATGTAAPGFSDQAVTNNTAVSADARIVHRLNLEHLVVDPDDNTHSLVKIGLVPSTYKAIHQQRGCKVFMGRAKGVTSTNLEYDLGHEGATAVVTVDGTAAAGSSDGVGFVHPVTISDSDNTVIKVAVTAENGSDSETYTITVLPGHRASGGKRLRDLNTACNHDGTPASP